MDPIALSAVMLAILTGVSEALGDRLWTGMISLVRRPMHNKTKKNVSQAPIQTGEVELMALQQAPGDQEKAIALAKVVLARAEADKGFKQALNKWWEQAQPVREKTGDVANIISGGKQQGPILQGRDFTGVTFGAVPLPSGPPAKVRRKAGE